MTIDGVILRLTQQATPAMKGVPLKAPGPFGAILYPLEDVTIDAEGTLRLVLGVSAAGEGDNMLTAAEKAKAKADLQAKGCPDDCVDRVLALPQAAGPFLTILLSLVAKYGPGILADILALLNPPPAP